MYKYIKWERTVPLEVKNNIPTFLLHTFNYSYFFSLYRSFNPFFQMLFVSPRRRIFYIWRGVERMWADHSEPVIVCVSEYIVAWEGGHTTQHTHKNSANRCIVKRCEWAEFIEMCEKHIYATPFFPYFHTASKSFEILS